MDDDASVNKWKQLIGKSINVFDPLRRLDGNCTRDTTINILLIKLDF